jgi:hypothetical protein
MVSVFFNLVFVYPLGFAFSFDPTSRESRKCPISLVINDSLVDDYGFALDAADRGILGFRSIEVNG